VSPASAEQNVLLVPRSVLQLIVTANVVPSLLTLFALIMATVGSPETSVLTRALRRHILENDLFQSAQ
jgi:ABC-type dipeptide/oligopeptide/nickel transport system permease subunit